MPAPTDDMLQSLIASKLGASPGAAPAAAAAAPGAADPAALAAAAAGAQGGAAPAAPKADPAPTQQEMGAAKVAPKDAGSEEPFTFVEIDDGEGGKRSLTTAQIKSTFDRYSALNHKWQTEAAPMKPVLDVVKQMMDAAKSAGHDPKADDVAKLVQAAVQAYVSNPQMGGKKAGAGKDDAPAGGDGKGEMSPPADDEGELSKWEKANAVSLPPGYKENIAMTKGLSDKLDQMIALLSKSTTAAAAGDDALAQANQVAKNGQAAAMTGAKQAIQSNIQGAMQGAGLQPADVKDFQTFAIARGYSPEDFIDPELTKTVVTDFKANRDAPEIGRLREIAQRRQAFTGSVEGAPGGAAAPVAASGDPIFAKMLGNTMGSKNMG